MRTTNRSLIITKEVIEYCLGIFLNFFILFATTVQMFLPEIIGVDLQVFMNTIIVLQILSILLSFDFENTVEKSVFGMSKKEKLKEINPQKNPADIENTRKELRYGIDILLTGATICYFILCIFHVDFLLLVFVVSITVLIYMYADYIPHNKHYAETYDSHFIKDKKDANAIRGLARIYLDEYKETKFKYKNELYTKIGKFDYDDENEFQDDCIKAILYMYADSVECPNIIFSIVLLIFNIILTMPDVVNIIMETSGYSLDMETDKFYLLYATLFINVVFAMLNYTTIILCRPNNEKIKLICKDILTVDKKERFEGYCDYAIHKSIIARGIFVFSSKYINDFNPNIPIGKIELPYRMQLIHRYYANIPRFWVTVALTTLAIFTILFRLYVGNYYILMVAVGLFLMTVISRVFILPRIGKRKIIKACKELENSR